MTKIRVDLKDESLNREYRPFALEGYLESALHARNQSFEAPRKFRLSYDALQGDDPVIERHFSYGNIDIKYQRWIGTNSIDMTDKLYNELKKLEKNGDVSGLTKIVNNPQKTWELLDFDNSTGNCTLIFPNGKSVGSDIETGNNMGYLGGVHILNRGMEKALALGNPALRNPQFYLGFAEKFANKYSGSFEKRLKGVGALMNVKHKLDERQQKELAMKHDLPEVLVENYFRTTDPNPIVENRDMLSYLSTGHEGSSINIGDFVAYMRKSRVDLSDENLVHGFVEGTYKSQEMYEKEMLRDAEKMGRDLVRLRIDGKPTKPYITGEDFLVRAFDKAMEHKDMFWNQKRVQYITSFLDGIYFEAVKSRQ